MPLDYGKPIYQAYVDAVKGQQEMQMQAQEMQVRKLQIYQDSLNIQQQMMERQAAAQVFGSQGATPSTAAAGQDPSEQIAAKFDKMSQVLGPINPKLAVEYATKASTLRDQMLTRQKNAIQITNAKNDEVGRLLSGVKQGDQNGYTEALMKLSDMGIDINQWQLTGNVVQDYPKLAQIAKGTMSLKDKLNAQHQETQEQISQGTLNEKIRADSARIGIEGQRLGLEASKLALDKTFKTDELEYKSRADARAAAGFARSTDMDLGKSKAFAAKPGAGDKPYVSSLVDNDPALSGLSDKAKQAAQAEIILTARSALAKQVTKPGQTPTSEDFINEANKAAAKIAKRVQPGSSGGMFSSSTKANLPPLPPRLSSAAEAKDLAVGAQFSYNGKTYKKTGPDTADEVK
jgi:hypothetical protein